MTLRDAASGEPLRVHRVIARLNVGGAACDGGVRSSGLDEYGVATRLFAGALGPGEADMAYRAQARGVAVTVVPGLGPQPRLWNDLRALFSLVRTFRAERPHIVHTHTAKAGALGRMAAVLARVPLRVHTYHGHVLGGAYFSPTTTRAYRFLERALGRLTSRILVLSESQRHELVDHLGTNPERVRVVPLGFDLTRFLKVDEGSRSALRARMEIEEEVALIGIVGRLVPVKNHALLLRALAHLKERTTRPIKLLVVGGGEATHEQALRDLASSLGLSESVIWAGWVREVEDVYPALDVLALTSLDEGTPVALIEGLAAGCPVVARAVGGVPDLLEEGAMVRTVQGVDPRDFAQALEQALDAPPSVAEREDARTQMAKRFGIQRLLRDVVDVYHELGVEIVETESHLPGR